MTTSKEAFEAVARVKLAYLGGPFLRECNDPYPDRDYQKVEVQEAWEFWQACDAHWREKLQVFMVSESAEISLDTRAGDVVSIKRTISNSISLDELREKLQSEEASVAQALFEEHKIAVKPRIHMEQELKWWHEKDRFYSAAKAALAAISKKMGV